MDSRPFAADTALPCTIRPSPNHGDRKGRAIDAIILHYTDLPDAEAALAVLTNPATEVSSHYVVGEDGTLFQLVPEERRAWHAGRSYWQGERDMNSASIGIEIANAGHRGGLPPFPQVQIDAVIALCQDIMQRRAVPPARILGHSDIAPGRKIDPGERFPWHELANAGLGLWPPKASVAEPTTAPILAVGARGSRIAALQNALARWGLDAPESGDFDYVTQIGIASFQRHFRQSRVDSVADATTVAFLQAVAGIAASPTAERQNLLDFCAAQNTNGDSNDLPRC